MADYVDALAKLAVGVGANVEPGQTVVLYVVSRPGAS